MNEIRVKIRYYNLLREAAGRSQEEVALPGPATPRDLLLALVKRHGPGLGRWFLTANGEVSRGLRLFVNGKPPDRDQILEDGDEIAIFMAISGGTARKIVLAPTLDCSGPTLGGASL